MKKIDFTKMKGEELFYYFTHDHGDKEYSSVVAMLPYATMDLRKAYEVLERVVRDGKTLVVVYPGIKNTDTSQMEHVGGVIDGDMYIQ